MKRLPYRRRRLYSRDTAAPRRSIPVSGAPMSYLHWSGQKAPKPVSASKRKGGEA